MNKAICKKCKEVITSERGGHYVTCKCGESSLDTDRWFPDRVRYMGEARPIDENGEPIEFNTGDES